MDEVLAGRATRVEVELAEDGGVRVAHDGVSPDLDDRLASLTVGRPRGLGYVPIAAFGLDLAVVNALSRRLVTEAEDGSTAITFWPDPDIFETTQCSFDVVAEHCRSVALLNRGLDVTVTGGQRSNHFHFPDGVRALVVILDEEDPSSEPLHPEVISFERKDPAAFATSGAMEVAFRWRASGPERVRSFCETGGPVLLGLHPRHVGQRRRVPRCPNRCRRPPRRLAEAASAIGGRGPGPDHLPGAASLIRARLALPDTARAPNRRPSQGYHLGKSADL